MITSNVEALWDDMYDATSYYGRRGAVIHAISALDNRALGLAGEGPRKALARVARKTNATGCSTYGTIYPLGETPDAVRKNIDRGLKLGLKAIKIVADPFWRDDLDLTAKLIRAAREHVGNGVRLMVDAATAWVKAEEGLPLCPCSRNTIRLARSSASPRRSGRARPLPGLRGADRRRRSRPNYLR